MLLVTCFWAGNFLAGKYALQGFVPFALAQLRIAAAALLLGAFFLFRGRHSRFPSRPKEWLFLALLGFLGITVNQLCFVTGLARTSVLHAGLIGGFGPVIIYGLAVISGDEALTIRKLSGMVVSCGGLALLVTQKNDPAAQATWLGDLLVLAGIVAFSSYTMLEKRIAGRYDNLTLNAFVFGLGGLLMLPFAARSTAAVRWSEVPVAAWWGLAFLVLCGSVIAYALYAFALGELTASKVGAFAYLQPVLVAVLAVLFVHERLTVIKIVGSVLVLVGMYLAGRPAARHAHRLAHSGA
jgi:drug/metabolite transporter (DMT)-like permease